MPVLNTTAAATAPAAPSCTLIAQNSSIHNSFIDRWPHCVIKQSYNATGENYSALTATTIIAQPTLTAQPTPTTTAVSGNSFTDYRGIPGYVFLAILSIAGLIVIGAHCCQGPPNPQEPRHPPAAPPRRQRPRQTPRRQTQTHHLQDLKTWFTRKFTRSSPESRAQNPNIENAVQLTPVERLSLRVRSLSKRRPATPDRPLGNPPGTIAMVDLERQDHNIAQDVNGLPPAYQTSEHLPLPTVPALAYGASARNRLDEYRSPLLPAPIPARSAARLSSQTPAPAPPPAEARPQFPPPHYNNHHADPRYTSESEDEHEAGDDDEPDLRGDEGDFEWNHVVDPEDDPWRDAERGDLYSANR
ncbi:hypothetical protein VTL71DRAFT_6877 [Oculimacula yallundae]|uniref:Transmembrane protein n=1 Tax=Oculimacula yallundae TaxID=86028 RepID=A0ABR4BV52_9HELO